MSLTLMAQFEESFGQVSINVDCYVGRFHEAMFNSPLFTRNCLFLNGLTALSRQKFYIIAAVLRNFHVYMACWIYRFHRSLNLYLP